MYYRVIDNFAVHAFGSEFGERRYIEEVLYHLGAVLIGAFESNADFVIMSVFENAQRNMEYQLNENDYRSCAERNPVHSRTRSHTDSRGQPDARRGSKPVNGLLTVKYHSRADKTYARHHLRSDTRSVEIARVRKAVFGNNHKDARARGNYGVRPYSAHFMAELALDTHYETEPHRH